MTLLPTIPSSFMSQPQTTPDDDRYRIADDITNPNSVTHLLGEEDTVTLCGNDVMPKSIGGTAITDDLPTVRTISESDLCPHCVSRAKDSDQMSF